MAEQTAADLLADAGFHIEGAWRSRNGWSVRVASDYDADHDTYHTSGGDTFDQALDAAWAWWAPLADLPSDGGVQQ